MEKSHYICIPAIDVDSVLKIDKKNVPANLFRGM